MKKGIDWEKILVKHLGDKDKPAQERIRLMFGEDATGCEMGHGTHISPPRLPPALMEHIHVQQGFPGGDQAEASRA